MTSEDISFGKWVRAQRRSLDLSREALADRVGCAEITLRRIELGSLKPSKELARILLARLGIPESEQVPWVLFARGLAGFPASSHPDAPTKPHTALPVYLTEFIGREKEQAAVVHLISRHRLVTLTGPGGVGKTRLAAIVGEQISAEYFDGVQMVELASVTDPDLVPQAVATPFGIPSQTKVPSVELLVGSLRASRALVILDNCEHLLLACAQLADTILKNCPGLRILATSREPLLLPGEAVFLVPSLEIPDDHQSLNECRAAESVRLFEERARLARSDFSLDNQNLSTVLQVCRRLDGIPLAIELAAARMDVFSVEQIAARLDASFDLLTGGGRTLLPRQQTLRGSMDWSWGLLSDEERLVLCRLSIFSGGWALEAAEIVCSGNAIRTQRVPILLAQLAAKSLVAVSPAHGQDRRYSLHEIIHQYAHEKLNREEEVYARTRHLQYYLEFSKQAEPALRGDEQSGWLARLDAELANVRAALDWACHADLEAGLYILGQLGESIDLHEVMSWASDLLADPESHRYPHARAKALLVQAGYIWLAQQFEAARTACEEAIELFRLCNDREGEFGGLMLLGSIYQYLEGMGRRSEIHLQALMLARALGDDWRQAKATCALGWDRRDHRRSLEYWEESLRLYRKLEDWQGLAMLLGVYGDTLVAYGEEDAAEALLVECLAVSQRVGYRPSMEFALVARSRQALAARQFIQARAYLQQWIEIAEEIGNRMGYLWGRARLGYVALLEGNLDEGSRILRDTARAFHVDRNKVGLAFAFEKLSHLFAISGLPDHAVRLLGWADQTREELGEVRPPIEQTDVARDLAAYLSSMGPDAIKTALEHGRQMSLDEAMALALQDA